MSEQGSAPESTRRTADQDTAESWLRELARGSVVVEVPDPERLRARVVEAPVAPDFYRLSGKIRVIVLSIMLSLNFSVSLDPLKQSIRPDVWHQFMVINTPLVLAAIVIGLLIWTRPFSARTQRALTLTCLVLETTSGLLFQGFVEVHTSHLIAAMMLSTLGYRLFFDFATGMTSFAYYLVGFWALLIAQATGLLPTNPALLRPAPFAPAFIAAGLSITAMFVATFMAANYMVRRVSSRDHAIRLLASRNFGEAATAAGQHTGRLLSKRYALEERIGSGGMGEVYRARDVQEQRRVAVKVLHAHLLDQTRAIQRFKVEAEIASRLSSEHIARMLDASASDELPYMVLEYLEGESLEQRLRREPMLPHAVVAEIVRQTATGLSQAHESKVVHRDLKPANLFLVPSGPGFVVKILDFGISKVIDSTSSLTQEAALLGTPDYMAPEQAVGDNKRVGIRTDTYALGAIAYRALTGRVPFVGESLPALLWRICSDAPAAPSSLRPELPPAVDAVLGVALAKREEDRYASATELANDLGAALAAQVS